MVAFFCLFIHLFTCLLIYLFICIFVYIFICLFIYSLPVNLFIYLSVNFFICSYIFTKVCGWFLRTGMLGRIFRPRRVEMTDSWRKLNSEDICNLQSSPNISRMSKCCNFLTVTDRSGGCLMRMRWVGQVACMGSIVKFHQHGLLSGFSHRTVCRQVQLFAQTCSVSHQL